MHRTAWWAWKDSNYQPKSYGPSFFDRGNRLGPLLTQRRPISANSLLKGLDFALQTERQCHRADKGRLAALDPAPLAMPPLWGFGGDGA